MNLVCKCIQAFNFFICILSWMCSGLKRRLAFNFFIVSKCSEIAPFCMEKSYPIWLLYTFKWYLEPLWGAAFIILIVFGCRTVVFLGVLHGLHYLQHCTITTLEKAVYFTDACLVISLLCYNGRVFCDVWNLCFLYKQVQFRVV